MSRVISLSRRSLIIGAGATFFPGLAKAGLFLLGALPPLPLNSPMIVTGNSWASGSVSYNSTTDNRALRWAVPTALMEYTGNKWRMTVEGNKAVSGVLAMSGSNNIAGQLSGALATLPAGKPFVWLCPEFILNDVAGGDITLGNVGSYISNIQSQIATVVAAGGRCILGLCPPQQPGSGTWTPTQLSIIASFNAAMLALSSLTVKLINYNNIGLLSTDFANGIHLTTNGWDKVAAFVVATGLLVGWLPTNNVIDSLSTLYTTNPTLTGGSSAGPSGYTITPPSGVTATWNTANNQLTITGTAPSNGVSVDMSASDGNSPLPVTGNPIEGVLDYNIVSETGLQAVTLLGQIFNASFSTLMDGYASVYAPGVAETAAQMARAPGHYVNRTPQVPMGSGTADYRQTDLKVYLIAGTVNIVLQLNWMGNQLCV